MREEIFAQLCFSRPRLCPSLLIDELEDASHSNRLQARSCMYFKYPF